jgi:hypothetical protein
MTILHLKMLRAAFVIATAPLSPPALHAYSPAVTTQLVQMDPQPRRPTICTEQYAPVCGRLGNAVKTYPNQCYARAAGAEVISMGECSTGPAPSPHTR